jgi:CTP synthase
MLADMSGIFVAPGSGSRGFDGKIEAVRYARENNIPFFGVALGMESAVVEFARNVLGIKDAHSREMDPQTKNPVVDIMEEQKKVMAKDGTMRLGGFACALKSGSKSAEAYGKESIVERHRHRFEFNSKYLDQFEKAGMIAVGTNPDTGLVEAMELKNHPWFVGVLFDPEYHSTVATPAPLFVAFVAAALEYQKSKKATEEASK